MGIHGIVGLEDALNMSFVDKVTLEKCKYNYFLRVGAKVDGRVMFCGEGPRLVGG
jgi:hypothetical protein